MSSDGLVLVLSLCACLRCLVWRGVAGSFTLSVVPRVKATDRVLPRITTLASRMPLVPRNSPPNEATQTRTQSQQHQQSVGGGAQINTLVILLWEATFEGMWLFFQGGANDQNHQTGKTKAFYRRTRHLWELSRKVEEHKDPKTSQTIGKYGHMSRPMQNRGRQQQRQQQARV